MTFREFVALVIVAVLFFGLYTAVQGRDDFFSKPLPEYNNVIEVPNPLLTLPNIGKAITEQEIRQQTGQTQGCKYAGENCGVNAANVVTSIVFGYRGYDTLGEATILFVAITGLVYMVTSLRGGMHP